MADPARLLVEEIHKRLEELQTSPLELAFTKSEGNEHTVPPRILWVYGPLETTPAERIGGDANAIAVRAQTFEVAVWHVDHEQCVLAYENLLRALREVALPVNFTLGPFDWVTEDGKPNNLGEVLMGPVILKLPVREVPAPEFALITSHTHSVTVNSEEVC